MNCFDFVWLTILLTEEGLERWRDVYEYVYKYIRLMEKDGIQEWIFKEIQMMNKIGFDF